MKFTDECMPIVYICAHDEIFNFTDVERTNTEINVPFLFDNAND